MRDLIATGVRSAGYWIAPVFLAALLCLGGASRGAVLPNGILQVASALILVWCCMDRRLKLSPSAYAFLVLALVFLIVTLLQLVPLPPDVWTALPGRQSVIDGFGAVDAPLPWLPVSMTPEETLGGALRFLPPLAAFVLVARMPPSAIAGQLAWAIVLFAAGSVLLGVAQVFGGDKSPLYFYDFTNRGMPVGFMANVNHQATLLLMSVSIAATLVARLSVRLQLGDRDVGEAIFVLALMCLIILGVMICGSLAGYALLLPALLLAVLIARSRQWGRGTAISLLVAVLVIGLLGVIVASSPVLKGLGVSDFSSASLSRPDTYTRTLAAIADVFPIGSGLGSFEALFPSYEDPVLVGRNFMNHVHSDYLEIALEYGVVGILLVIGFFVWFALRCAEILKSDGGEGSRLRQAAAAAVVIVLLHSMVDYPLRTAAIAGLTAMCLGVMAGRSRQASATRTLATPASGKHVSI